MRFLFFDCRDRRSLFNSIASQLRSEGHIVSVVVHQGKDVSLENTFDTVYYIDENIDDFYFTYEQALENTSVEWIAPVLDRIERLNLDIDLVNLPRKVINSHQYIEDIFDRFMPDCVLSEPEADPVSMSAVSIAKKRRIKFYTLLMISLIPGKVLLMPCSYADTPSFLQDRIFKNRKLGNSFKDFAEIKSYDEEERHKSYKTHASWFQHTRIWPLALLELLYRIIQYNFILPFKQKQSADYFLGDIDKLSVKALIYRLKRNLKMPIILLLSHLSKKSILKNIPVVEIALQYRPEASSSVIGLKYIDVDLIIRFAKKHFPNHQIILKEHPLVFGYNNLSFYIKHIFINKNIVWIFRKREFKKDDIIIANTSTYAFDMRKFGLKNIIVLGNVSHKILDQTNAKESISINEFLYTYEKFCLEDDEYLQRSISYILKSNNN